LDKKIKQTSVQLYIENNKKIELDSSFSRKNFW